MQIRVRQAILPACNTILLHCILADRIVWVTQRRTKKMCAG